MDSSLKKNKGVTLIELMVGLVASSLLIAALYRTFISQQKTYIFQEQAVDIQQNARISISKMMKEIRMAGFGDVWAVLPISFEVYGKTRTFDNIINIDTPTSGAITIISAILTEAIVHKKPGDYFGENRLLPNQFIVSRLKDESGAPLFDTEKRRYISIGGIESHTISDISPEYKRLTLTRDIIHNHPVGTPVFTIRAISYQIVSEKKTSTLKRDENIGGGRQPLAENVENLQFEYLDANAKPTTIPGNIRIMRLTVTTRSDTPSPELRRGDGYQRRQIASYVHLRNMRLLP